MLVAVMVRGIVILLQRTGMKTAPVAVSIPVAPALDQTAAHATSAWCRSAASGLDLDRPYHPPNVACAPAHAALTSTRESKDQAMLKHLKITVEGKVYDVVVEDVTEDAGSTFYQTSSLSPVQAPPPPVSAPRAAPAAVPVAGGDDKPAPLAGVVVEVSVNVGAAVKTGDKVMVIEAMKMKTVVSAHKDGKVTAIHVKQGEAVDAGQALVTIS